MLVILLLGCGSTQSPGCTEVVRGAQREDSLGAAISSLLEGDAPSGAFLPELTRALPQLDSTTLLSNRGAVALLQLARGSRGSFTLDERSLPV